MHARTVAVMYLARGYDPDHLDRFEAFAASYRSHEAGCPHTLYVVFKGFADREARQKAEGVFRDLKFLAVETDDLHYDIGAYADALRSVTEEYVCFLNTNSTIASPYWLEKLIRNLECPGVGMVSATGSYESLYYINRTFPEFPNAHLRSNAFALRRAHAAEILRSYAITGKLDTFHIESGGDGITRQVMGRGLTVLIVGADGRGYPPQHWARSETFRQGTQGNLLVHDNQTKAFESMDAAQRQRIVAATWGVALPATVADG